MTDRPRISLLRLAAQGVVVGAAVLGALEIDRRRDALAAADAETAVLVELREELRAFTHHLESWPERHRASERAALRLIRIVDGDAPLYAEPVDSLIWATFLDATLFSPPLGGIDALIASGALDGLDDDEVKSAVRAWRGSVGRTERLARSIADEVAGSWRPYLVRNELLRPAERIWPSFRDIGPGTRAYDFGGMLEDPEFESLVLVRLEHERHLLAAIEALRTETTALMERLDAALG